MKKAIRIKVVFIVKTTFVYGEKKGEEKYDEFDSIESALKEVERVNSASVLERVANLEAVNYHEVIFNEILGFDTYKRIESFVVAR